MPRYVQPTELTPFAQLLVDYMWNRRSPTQPPLGVAQLAARLSLPRQNVNNWIVRGTVPTFEVILEVLARLNIPLRELYDAYQRAGLTVPQWDKHDTAAHAPASSENAAISRSRKPTAIPISLEYDDGSYFTAPVPRPYIPPAPINPAEAEAAEWQRFIDQTTAALREAGLPESEIEGVIAYMRARQHGTDPIQRHISAEHSEPAEPSEPAPNPADEQPRQQPAQMGTRKSPSNARNEPREP